MIYIIISVHNRREISLDCLANLKECSDLGSYRTIVIDNGSSDRTSE